ncbi:hypothetical protein KQI30_03720 [Clostridium bornimense]|nr:hypothetical protein [Clostridium bornimense]MBU5315387.1 hypothetical protein [Clostridium bornimense]
MKDAIDVVISISLVVYAGVELLYIFYMKLENNYLMVHFHFDIRRIKI